MIVLAVHLCSIFSILSSHSKEKDCFRKKLFSASCNSARSKLIFINTFMQFSSLRDILLNYFLAKQLQNCIYLKAYICTGTHTNNYNTFLYSFKIQRCFILGYSDPKGKNFPEGIKGKKKNIIGAFQHLSENIYS